MRSLFGLNFIHLVILGYAHLWSVKAAESADLAESLQSDQLWRDHPSEAVRSLEMLLKQDSQLALSILIQRYDGWSEIGLKDASWARPKEEPYTLAPLVKKLDQREVEQLYELLATKDFHLTEMQGLRLHLGTASRYFPTLWKARDEHIREVAKKRAFTLRQVCRLEEALGVYPISSELAKELEDDMLWQKQPELAVKRLETLFEVHPSTGVMILLTKFCRYARDESSDPAQLHPLRAYSFVPFFEKLTPRRNLETLFNLMAIRDFELSDQQVIQLRRAVSARYPNPAAFLNHVAEYVGRREYGYLPEHRKRLERQLGITLPPKRD